MFHLIKHSDFLAVGGLLTGALAAMIFIVLGFPQRAGLFGVMAVLGFVLAIIAPFIGSGTI